MSRIAFRSNQEQRNFLSQVENKLQLNVDRLAQLCSVHPRTFRDWRRGKYKLPKEALDLLCARCGIDFPKAEILPEFWSRKEAGRSGALARYQVYGNPGTLEGRQKAGRLLAEWLRRHPEVAKRNSAVVAKDIKHPTLSPLLAEFVGILIGDGGIRSRFQVIVSFNHSTDREHAAWIQCTVKRLFGLGSFQMERKGTLGSDIVISSVRLVQFLEKVAGLRPGHKLRNGLDLPPWIWERRSYQIACLRGLMDTDGGPFVHRYQVNGKWYAYPKLAFCSLSDQLLESVCRLFAELGFHPRLARNHQVFIDRTADVKRFYRIIGSRHQRHHRLVRNVIVSH